MVQIDRKTLHAAVQAKCWTSNNARTAIMSLQSHRLPPPVSQTVGGASAAAAATATNQLSEAETSSVGDRYRQRQTGQGISATVVEPSIPTGRQMLPSKQDSGSTARTAAVTYADSKRPGSDIPRLMRPQSVLKSYMKYLTPYEQQEIFSYPQVERNKRVV